MLAVVSAALAFTPVTRVDVSAARAPPPPAMMAPPPPASLVESGTPRLRKRDRIFNAVKGVVRRVKGQPTEEQEQWPFVGGTHKYHFMRGPYPPPPRRELWTPPEGWTPPSRKVAVESWYDSGVRLQPAEAMVAPTPVTVASWYDSGTRLQPAAAAVASSSNVATAPETPNQPKTQTVAKKAAAKNVPSTQGIFAPLVLGAKRVMGEQELKELRAAVITKHSKVIAEFVDTSESPFGQLVLRRMFEFADKDGNGSLDKEEVRSALNDLGFDFLNAKQVDQIVKRADADQNEVIDFEEFVKETPKVLRTNLVKLAKKNGHDLGFLV